MTNNTNNLNKKSKKKNKNKVITNANTSLDSNTIFENEAKKLDSNTIIEPTKTECPVRGEYFQTGQFHHNSANFAHSQTQPNDKHNALVKTKTKTSTTKKKNQKLKNYDNINNNEIIHHSDYSENQNKKTNNANIVINSAPCNETTGLRQPQDNTGLRQPQDTNELQQPNDTTDPGQTKDNTEPDQPNDSTELGQTNNITSLFENNQIENIIENSTEDNFEPINKNDVWDKCLEAVKNTTGNIYRFAWRWTLNEDATEEEKKNFYNLNYINDHLNELDPKHYIYQLELGDKTNKYHYQGFLKLKRKTRVQTLTKLLNVPFKGIWITPAYDEKAVIKYCSKEETRIAGPFDNTNNYQGEDLHDLITGMYQWQRSIEHYVTTCDPCPRKIFWIWDPVGNNGKTFFVKYLCWKYKALLLTWSKPDDIKFARANSKDTDIVICDFTRTKSKFSDMDGMYECLESIKSGAFMVGKYESKNYIGKCPHLFVFSNYLPDRQKLSNDRWAIARIGFESKTYIPMDFEQEIDFAYDIYVQEEKKKQTEMIQNKINKEGGNPFLSKEQFKFRRDKSYIPSKELLLKYGN